MAFFSNLNVISCISVCICSLFSFHYVPLRRAWIHFFTHFQLIFIHIDTHLHTSTPLWNLFSKVKISQLLVCPCQTKLVSGPECACNARHFSLFHSPLLWSFSVLAERWPGDVLGKIWEWSSIWSGTALWHDLRCTHRQVKSWGTHMKPGPNCFMKWQTRKQQDFRFFIPFHSRLELILWDLWDHKYLWFAPNLSLFSGKESNPYNVNVNAATSNSLEAAEKGQ